MKVIIYTSFDCLVKADEEEETLETNQHIVLDHAPMHLIIYPTGKTLRPSFEIDLFEKSSSFYRIVEKEDKVLIFLLDGVYAQNIKVYSLLVEDKNCVIEVGQTEIMFSCGGNKKILSFPKRIRTSECGKFHHIAYVKVETQIDVCLVAYNCKTFQAKILKGKNIEVMKNGFVVSSQVQGYKKIEEEYIVTEEGLKIKERSFSAQSFNCPPSLICYRFMQAVYYGDFTSALAMLAPELAKTLSVNLLRNFFGNVSYFFPLESYCCFAISNNKNKMYSFTVENEKISEINDEE